MKLNEVLELVQGENITVDSDVDITSAIACDMLSVVMANGKAKGAFVTIQSSMNTIAVASLLDMGCIILARNTNMENKVIEKAKEEGIPVIKSPLTTFEICGILYGSGLK